MARTAARNQQIADQYNSAAASPKSLIVIGVIACRGPSRRPARGRVNYSTGDAIGRAIVLGQRNSVHPSPCLAPLARRAFETSWMQLAGCPDSSSLNQKEWVGKARVGSASAALQAGACG